jgi:hypothetical protein
VQLPTTRCKPVLLSLSAGDRRSQQALDAGGHLLACETCAELSSPLLERRRALAMILPLPLGKALWTVFKEAVREHPVASASAGGVVVAAGVAGGVLVAADDPAPPVPPPASVAAPAPTPPVPSSVVVDGQPVPPVEPGDTLLPYAGRPVEVQRARVESVPADEGFWVGDGPDRRLWVQLTDVDESPAVVRPGQTVSFLGTVVTTPAGFAPAVGVDAAEGADQVQQQAAHLEVRAADLRLG